MKPYADSNYFSRLYLRLNTSHDVAERLKDAHSEMSSALPLIWLHRIEVLNAFQLYVFVSKSGGPVRITPEQAAAAQANFIEDLREGSFIRAQDIDFAELEHRFEELALRHSARHGFRTYDILHVSIALLLNCDSFWTFDLKARKLAALEGLDV